MAVIIVGQPPYSINSDNDSYPLMKRFENYFEFLSEQPRLKAPWEGIARITQGNNGTTSHYDHGTWDNTYAIDVALPVGSDVLAPADGVVKYVDNDPSEAGGKELALEHTGPTGGKFVTVYLHLSDILVGEGDFVKQGQVVAKSGATGNVTGPHLHFHMWRPKGSEPEWSYDAHTMPIERLVMKQVGVDSDFREYDAKKSELDDNKIAGKYFESNINLIERIYGIPVDFRFNKNIRKGNNHPEVRYLQIVLNTDPDTQVTTSGFGSPGNETTYFGSLTEKAVIKFQEKYANEILEPLGLTSGTGFVGEKTRNKLNDILDQNFTEDYKKKFDLLNDTERKSAIWSYINESYKDYGLPEDFSKELILAIAAQETGEYAHWNNEHVADDWGRGIMQTTTNSYVGAGGVDSESEDCKKCKDREGKIYCSKYYSNTPKGIEANIKDGLYALSDKYQQVNKDKIQPPEGYTTQEIIWISTVQRYNTRKLHPTEYIRNICDKLVKLGNGEYGQFDGFDTQDAKSLGEKFKKAYSESLKLYSPAEIRVYDYKGNVTGLVNGEVREEIPNSIYDNVTKTVMIFSSHDYYYDVVGKDTGTYGLNMVSVKNEKETDFSITNVSTTTNATHQYLINWTAYSQSEEGVTLKIDSDGDGIFEETITIQPPIARFTYSPEYPAVNQGISFNASGSYDAEGFVTNYAWDFGDGNTTSTAEPIITHFYSLADDYDVILTVTDNDGATNSTSKIITVFPPTAIFDTGSPANPYPSIFGTHNGTIKPNQTITVSKLYTYPCTGTGGHTEYMKIWNSSDWNVTAKCEGYSGDWHNISFGNSFTLGEGETYNYTIRTGSYPQIHHNRTLSVPDGEITCSEFMDANGKEYDDWIPAIRLE